MIYLTSDWHLTPETIDGYVQKLDALGEEDTVINLGDLSNDWTLQGGLPWFCPKLSQMKCRMVLLDGNHDDINYLDLLPEEEYCGAKGSWLGDRLFHVSRGEVLSLEGKTFLTLGGGFSGNGYISRHPELWQPRETPCEKEMTHMLERCREHGFAFDYVLSHSAPLSLMREWGLGDEYNCFHAFLDGIRACTERRRWYLGHHHRQETWKNSYEILYRDLIRLD